MRNYITLNGKKYTTSGNNWFPVPSVPSTVRMLLDGTVDVTYGPGVMREWQGTIEFDHYPAEGYGGPQDFYEAATARAAIPFEDHYGEAMNVHLVAPAGFKHRALIPKWDASSNKWFVDVRIVKA